MPKTVQATTALADEVIQGDCLEVMRGLPEEIADCVFFDPPYFLQLPKKRLVRWKVKTTVDGVDEPWDQFENFEQYDNFIRSCLAEVQRLLKPTGTIWAIGTYHNIHRVGAMMQDLGYWILNDVIWFKTNPMPNWLQVRLTNATETILWAVKDKTAKGYTFHKEMAREFAEGKVATNVWRLPLCTGKERLKTADGKKLHPTQKPEALLDRILRISTNPGDLVLDPMAGVGTTGAVAARLGRHYLLIEACEQYATAAQQRVRGDHSLRTPA